MTIGAASRRNCARLLALCLLAGCSSSGGGTRYPLDGLLRFNHVQAKGTHNSYHVQPETVFAEEHRYTHAPLDVQLAEQGVRQFELDLHLRQGFEVYHLPLVFWLEPKDEADTELVRDLLAQGFVVTSNTDGVDQTNADNAAKLAGTLAAGSQFISSDLPARVYGHDYWFDLPDGAPARCNPATAPAECTSRDIEDLESGLGTHAGGPGATAFMPWRSRHAVAMW